MASVPTAGSPEEPVSPEPRGRPVRGCTGLLRADSCRDSPGLSPSLRLLGSLLPYPKFRQCLSGARPLFLACWRLSFLWLLPGSETREVAGGLVDEEEDLSSSVAIQKKGKRHWRPRREEEVGSALPTAVCHPSAALCMLSSYSFVKMVLLKLVSILPTLRSLSS